MPFPLFTVVQILVALILLNVWLLRAGRPTPFRGGHAKSLKEEFAVYDLPPAVMYLVGTLKILSAVALIVGLWFPVVVHPTAMVLCALMLGAVIMHIKAKDPLVKSLPALVMLILNAYLVWAS